jgi:hypothetical protein
MAVNRKKYKHKTFKQGYYKPVNRSKYRGSLNPKYRSSWELKFFRWCDNNTNVVEWSSESLAIPYVSPVDNKVHRYMVDNVVKIKEGNKIQKYVIEIKPKKQTLPPTTHGNKTRSTLLYENVMYATNMCKWNAAKEWCRRHGYKFQILTEDHLF